MGKEEISFQAKVSQILHLGQAGAILACGLSHDDKVAASCSTNNKVLLWEVESGSCIGTLDGHQADVTSCAFGKDLLATGSRDGMIFLWKFNAKKRTSRISVHAGAVNACVISPNCRYLASSSEDTTARLYTIRGGNGEFIQGPQCKELRGHTDSVNDIDFSADSAAVVTGSTDGNVRIWDSETGECLMKLEGDQGKITHARFSGDSRHIVTLTKTFVSVWSISKKKIVWQIENEKEFQTLSCHPSEDFFIVVTMDGNIAGHSISTRKELFKKSTNHRGPVLSCNFSLSGEKAVTGGIDGKVLVWN